MCGCEATFVCSRCADTPQDWRYHLPGAGPRSSAEERYDFAYGGTPDTDDEKEEG